MAAKRQAPAKLTAADIEAATARGAESMKREPMAVSVDCVENRIKIKTDRNWSFEFDPYEFAEFAGASGEELAEIKILGSGRTLEWTKLDVHLGVGSIIAALLGDEFLIAEGGLRAARRAERE